MAHQVGSTRASGSPSRLHAATRRGDHREPMRSASSDSRSRSSSFSHASICGAGMVPLHEPEIAPSAGPFPWAKAGVVAVILLMDTIALTQIFPYVAFMVRDFGMTSDMTQVGYYAGILASVYSLATLLSSFFWGRLSDLVGRRAVLLAGLITTTVTMVMYGLSGSFRTALLVRFMQGFLNGNLGVVKTYLGEALTTEQKAKGFALLGITDGVGRVLGPLIGGLLASPAEKYPWLFSRSSDALFVRFPYLLPCLVAAAISATGLLGAVFVLEETLTPPPYTVTALVTCGRFGTRSSRVYTRISLADDQFALEPDDGSECEAAPGVNGRGAKDGSGSDRTPDDEPIDVAAATGSGRGGSVLRSREVLATTTMYGLLAFVYTVDDEAFPLFAVGKLHFDSTAIGIQMGVAGVVLLLYNMFVFESVSTRLGHLRSFRWFTLLGAPLFVLQPLLVAVIGVSNPRTLFVATLVHSCIKLAVSSTAFTAVIIMISNSAPNTSLGRVNGVGQTQASAARTLGPAMAGALFAWSMRNRVFPLNYFCIYLVLALLSVVNVALASVLDSSINRSHAERMGDAGVALVSVVPHV